MKKEEFLDKAKECVCGQREKDYGPMKRNFQMIADLWNAYLLPDDLTHTITSTDVAMMMALLKIARIKNGEGTEDGFIDLAGYAACGGELNTLEKGDEVYFE